METTFRLNTSDLNTRFLTTLKSLFIKREIEITVSDVINDETDFLLKDPVNKAYLLKAIGEVKNNKNLHRFSGEEFEIYTKSLLKK